MFLALRQQLAPHFLPQGPQRIELLVVKFCPPAHTWFADLGEPLRTMARCIDLLATTRNRPTAVQRLHPRHDPCDIFAEGKITAHQLLEGSYPVLPVIDRLELFATQELGQLPCIDAVTLTALFQQSI